MTLHGLTVPEPVVVSDVVPMSPSRVVLVNSGWSFSRTEDCGIRGDFDDPLGRTARLLEFLRADTFTGSAGARRDALEATLATRQFSSVETRKTLPILMIV